ncbi:glucosaminidase domain-containing protein [Campylobacter hyointestinalis]|uniref:glucosaminidase domain-containing protein n=1 Tax=Campylobacter hyointestinalis TaxID=198 RepID=UPI00215CEF47|nr:glucosaminidase domain-containing protein [Campylobacter hyointestinalis]
MIRRFIKFFLILLALPLFGGLEEYYYKLSIKEQKIEFPKLINEMVQDANQNTLRSREFALNYLNLIYEKSFRDLNLSNLDRLFSIAKTYKIQKIFDPSEYISKLDVIPVSLAIAQAAVESGWGKSRFAKEANNLYGHWTWGGKGLVPLNRDENKTHKIKIFNSPNDAVDAYVLNLNSHPAYTKFRENRLKFHQNELIYTGLDAAKTMEPYSAMGKIYVKQLEKTIRLYDLTKFDRI